LSVARESPGINTFIMLIYGFSRPLYVFQVVGLKSFIDFIIYVHNLNVFHIIFYCTYALLGLLFVLFVETKTTD